MTQTADDLRRIAMLARETMDDWTRRFHRERGLPEPDSAELAKMRKLDAEDVKACPQ